MTGCTNPLLSESAEMILETASTDYANASSAHLFGQDVARHIHDARLAFAKSIGAKEEELIFTAGTKENALAVRAYAKANVRKGKHIVASSLQNKEFGRILSVLEQEG